MGWAFCGLDGKGREIGYGIPATCDEEGCEAEIDRGLAFCCGDMHRDNKHGCAGYFCYEHLFMHELGQFCQRCHLLSPPESDCGGCEGGCDVCASLGENQDYDERNFR